MARHLLGRGPHLPIPRPRPLPRRDAHPLPACPRLPHALSRTQAAAAASAPHKGDPRPPVFGPDHRPPISPAPFDQPHAAHRFATPRTTVTRDDAFAKPAPINVARDIGDFVIWRHVALPAYQLAVTVDDARQHITHIVRADDLIESAAQQHLLREALNLPHPTYHAHLPLVVGADGKRLAKRHGDTRLASYHAANLNPHRVIGLIAHWSGILPAPRLLSAEDFAAQFSLDRLPEAPAVFTKENEQWLNETH